jgi:hypothetical protein
MKTKNVINDEVMDLITKMESGIEHYNSRRYQLAYDIFNELSKASLSEDDMIDVNMYLELSSGKLMDKLIKDAKNDKYVGESINHDDVDLETLNRWINASM